MICLCEDWEKNIDKINAPFTFMIARQPLNYKGYDGKVFSFCPWCGSKLLENKEQI